MPLTFTDRNIIFATKTNNFVSENTLITQQVPESCRDYNFSIISNDTMTITTQATFTHTGAQNLVNKDINNK